jgi:hypothetical protein
LILVRLAWWLSAGKALRSLGAAVLALALPCATWWWLSAQPLWDQDWSAIDEYPEIERPEPGLLEDPEATIYAQPEILERALASIAPQRAQYIDLYAVAFGGDASEDVFRNEVDYFAQLMPQRFDATGHTLTLLNHPARSDAIPLATATNLDRALRDLGERMDREQDILFLYLTSHGSEEHEFFVNQPPLPLDQLDPASLRAILDRSGIRWRVIVLSACYSGGFIDALRDPHTLVLTAARADRPSFGCGATSQITWFGKAFLAQALNDTTDFVAAHDQARRSIRTWERADEIRASHPQIDLGAQIGPHLARWREQFEPGPALPFAPASQDDTRATQRPESEPRQPAEN